jgi:hypothetical protein
MTVKLTETMMEDALAADPERFLGESGLKLLVRQFRVGSYIFDILFEDRRGTKLIVEIQLGTLDRNHTYKILDYYEEYKAKQPGEFIELMVVANRITYERRHRLNAHGINWREIPVEKFLALNPRITAEETPHIDANELSREAGPPDTDKPLALRKTRHSSQRSHNPMTDAPEAFRQYQKQTNLFVDALVDALKKIEPPAKIDVDGRNVRADKPGNWFTSFSPVSWGRKVRSASTGQGSGYGNSVGVGYSINYKRNKHGEHFMRMLVGLESPFRKEFREDFKKEVSLAVATNKIPLPPGCRVWPNIQFDGFDIRGTYILECQPLPLGDNFWSDAIQNYVILNKEFNALILQFIRKYYERGAFSVRLEFG